MVAGARVGGCMVPLGFPLVGVGALVVGFVVIFGLPSPGLWARFGFVSFARGVGLVFFGRLPVGPEYGVWFDVGGCYGVVVVFPSFWGGRFCFGLMPFHSF